MDEIMTLAAKLAKLHEIIYQQMQEEVELIIKTKSTDIDRIEHCLDTLLDIPTQKGYDLLQRLCNYYMLINNQNATFYLKAYQEMHGLLPKQKTKKRT